MLRRRRARCAVNAARCTIRRGSTIAGRAAPEAHTIDGDVLGIDAVPDNANLHAVDVIATDDDGERFTVIGSKAANYTA